MTFSLDLWYISIAWREGVGIAVWICQKLKGRVLILGSSRFWKCIMCVCRASVTRVKGLGVLHWKMDFVDGLCLLLLRLLESRLRKLILCVHMSKHVKNCFCLNIYCLVFEWRSTYSKLTGVDRSEWVHNLQQTILRKAFTCYWKAVQYLKL